MKGNKKVDISLVYSDDDSFSVFLDGQCISSGIGFHVEELILGMTGIDSRGRTSHWEARIDPHREDNQVQSVISASEMQL